jgi:hypothetical protein
LQYIRLERRNIISIKTSGRWTDTLSWLIYIVLFRQMYTNNIKFVSWLSHRDVTIVEVTYRHGHGVQSRAAGLHLRTISPRKNCLILNWPKVYGGFCQWWTRSLWIISSNTVGKPGSLFSIKSNVTAGSCTWECTWKTPFVTRDLSLYSAVGIG